MKVTARLSVRSEHQPFWAEVVSGACGIVWALLRLFDPNAAPSRLRIAAVDMINNPALLTIMIASVAVIGAFQIGAAWLGDRTVRWAASLAMLVPWVILTDLAIHVRPVPPSSMTLFVAGTAICFLCVMKHGAYTKVPHF